MKINKQGGLTLIGFLLVLSLVIFVSFIGMKIGPIYMEYYSVVSAMNGVAAERGSANYSPYDIRVKVLNRLYVSYSAENVKEQHIKLTRSNGVTFAYSLRSAQSPSLVISMWLPSLTNRSDCPTDRCKTSLFPLETL